MKGMDHQQSVKAQFGSNAKNYVTSPLHAKGNDLEWMKQWVQQNGKGGILIDIATGGGHVANTMAPFFDKVVAFDLTPEMLEQARLFVTGNGHKNVEFTIGDAQALPFEDQSFDYVTCRIAPHHFPQVELFVKEVYRVLKTDGVFILADNIAPEKEELDEFYNELEKKRDFSHFRAYKKTEWISMIEHIGFRTESLVSFKKKFIFETWCKNMSLSAEKVEELTQWILSSSEDMKNYYMVETTCGKIQSFEGQSVVVIAKK